MIVDQEGDRAARHLMRHVVPIYFDLRKGSDARQFVCTSFAFTVNGRWLLMTAGHCITDVEKLRREHGYELVNCQLIDCLGLKAKFEEPIPFAYDDAAPMMICRDPTWDYGGMFLPDNTCRLLAANDIAPFDETYWNAEPAPEAIEAYFWLGIPEVITTVSPTQARLGASMIKLERLPKKPEDEGFCDTDAPMFYGAIIESPLPNFHGMSGGPILSFERPIAGTDRVHYWLHAMQVSTVRGKYVSGMEMQPLGRVLKEVSESKHRDSPAQS